MRTSAAGLCDAETGNEKAPAQGRGFVHRHGSEAEVDTDAWTAIVAVSMPVPVIPMPVIARAAIVAVPPPGAVMAVASFRNIACLQVFRATRLRSCICCLRSGKHQCACGEGSEDSCTLHRSVLLYVGATALRGHGSAENAQSVNQRVPSRETVAPRNRCCFAAASHLSVRCAFAPSLPSDSHLPLQGAAR